MLKLRRAIPALALALALTAGGTAAAKGPKTPHPGKGPNGTGAPGLNKIKHKGGVVKLDATSKWQATVTLPVPIANVGSVGAIPPATGTGPFYLPVTKGRVQLTKHGHGKKKQKLSGFVSHFGGLMFVGTDPARTLSATDLRANLSAGRAGKVSGTVGGRNVKLFDLSGTTVDGGSIKADLKLTRQLDDALTATFGTPADALAPGAVMGTIVIGPTP